MRTIRTLCLCIPMILLFWGGCRATESLQKPGAPTAKPVTPPGFSPKERISLTLPAGHGIFTAVVDDANGVRVRNLLSMAQTAPYGGDPRSPAGQTVTLAWDGKDDYGKPLPAGAYKIRGLSLPNLEALYDYAWYNPGDPPWEGYTHSGWGADRTGATGLVCIPAEANSPWHVAVSCPIAEGGDAIFMLDKSGKKVFGFKRDGAGSQCIAYSDGCLYIPLWGANALVKLSCRNGQFLSFQRPAGPVAQIQLEAPCTSIAAGSQHIALLLNPAPDNPSPKAAKPRIVFLERTTGQKVAAVVLDQPGHLAYNPEGVLYLSQPTGLVTLTTSGEKKPVPLPGMARPGALSFDSKSNLVIMDNGPDYQLKVYGPDRKLIRTIGTKGGQGKRLEYDANAMERFVSAVSVDSLGRVWTSEPYHPRRQVVWGQDGKLIRDFVGDTQYGASHCSLHNQDPTLATAYGVLYRIDPSKTQDYRPVRYLTSAPRPGSPFCIDMSGDGFSAGTLFRSAASGRMREYYLEVWQWGYVLFLEKNGDYRPVATLFFPKHPVIDAYAKSNPAYRDKDPIAAAYIWSDRNGDEIMQPQEQQLIPEYAKQGNGWTRGFAGWTLPMGPELGFYANALKILPVRFTADGAPVYDITKAEKFVDPLDTSYCLFCKVGNHLAGVRISNQRFAGEHVFFDDKGKLIARYPYDAWTVQGSMLKPVPLPGKTTGELFIAGTAHVNDDVGSVLAWQGNYGQAFIFSEDGLFVSSLFRDARNSPAGYGDRVVKGADWTNVSMQQQAFGAWFGRQDDGKFRYLFGRNAALVVDVVGLDQARRFDAGFVKIE